ncbi:MAG: 50S ribosomal protein L10, partial [Rhodothermales bacterium]|nr:50S ribosomal protein L10 [Rhodothermales bacterium]
MLHGPTAVAFSDEPATAARVMKKFRDDGKLEIPKLKGAHVDGAVYQADALELLAKLKSKEELLGEIIGLLQSPMSNVISALTAQGETLAGAIKVIAEGGAPGGARESAEDGPQDTAEVSAEDGPQDSAEVSAEENPQDSAVESADEAVEESADEAAEESSDESADDGDEKTEA